jgi:hypothetical protein
VNLRDLFALIPERAYYVVMACVTALILWGAWSYYSDASLLEIRIAAKQRELGRVISLKDTYLSYTGALRKGPDKKWSASGLSLGLIEGLVSKNLTSGTLNSMKPGTAKEQKGKSSAVVELKVTGAALGEAIAFVGAVESSGLVFKRLQFSLPQDEELIDLYATIGER